MIKEGRLDGVQCLSGMGGLRLGMEMVKRHFPEGTLFKITIKFMLI